MSNEKKQNEKFESKDFKSLLVIGTKNGGDRDFIQRFIAGNRKDIIISIASIMDELPAFAAMVEEAVIIFKSTDEQKENGKID
jgi:hypothetical protein